MDVKSASSRSFDKFVNGLDNLNDPFGYLVQLNSYLEGGKDDDLVKEKDRAAFLAIDKTLGKITLDIQSKNEVDYQQLVEETREMLAQASPPPRPYPDIPDGKSGNMKLGTVCGYCEFKYKCWPNLRTFTYSNGPKYFTRVEREPEVPEVKGVYQN